MIRTRTSDVSRAQLTERLRAYEARYGVPSTRLVEVFLRDGVLVESPDFHGWMDTYQLHQLVTQEG